MYQVTITRGSEITSLVAASALEAASIIRASLSLAFTPMVRRQTRTVIIHGATEAQAIPMPE